MNIAQVIVSSWCHKQQAVRSLAALCLLVLPAFGDSAQKGTPEVKVPTFIEIPLESGNFLSFLNQLHPENRIGYRLHEQTPLQVGSVPADAASAGIDPAAQIELEERFRSRPGVFVHKRPVTEEGWVPQDWTFYFVPVEDGFEMLWVVETKETGLNEFYAAQQCFRMGGKKNAEWRRKVAETPAFSEYDLWASLEEEGKDIASLSWVRRNDQWERVPATTDRLVCRTALGVSLEGRETDEPFDVLKTLGPNHEGKYAPDVDCGLITRTNLEGTWICGLYWDRTTHVSFHHPADCLHSSVNLGPLPPHSKRGIRGRIYWMEGSKVDLFELWKKEFNGSY